MKKKTKKNPSQKQAQAQTESHCIPLSAQLRVPFSFVLAYTSVRTPRFSIAGETTWSCFLVPVKRPNQICNAM
jgi:hypothetical protein